MRLRTAFAALSIVALASACAQEAEAPPEPAGAPPAQAAPAATPISYACESGQSVTVAYPDAASARLRVALSDPSRVAVHHSRPAPA